TPPYGSTGGKEPARESFFRQGSSAVAFSRDNSRFIVVDDRPVIQLLDAGGQQALVTLPLPDAETMATALFPDGQRAVSAGIDHKLRVWSLGATNGPLVVGEANGPVAKLAISSDGQRLAAGSPSGNIMIWDTASWKLNATNFCGAG